VSTDSSQGKANGKRITDRMSTGAAWIVASRVYMMLGLIIQTVVVARLLGPSLFGLAAIATTIAGIVEISTKQSLTSALVQLDKVTNEHLDTAFTLNLFRGVIIGVVLLSIAYPMASLYDDERVAPLLIALAISTSFFGISNPKIYIFTKNLVFWQDFARVVAERTAIVVVSVAIAYYYRSPWAVIAGVAAGQISLVVSSFFFVPYRPRLSLKKTRDLLSFSIWITLSNAVNAIFQKMDSLLVGYYLGNATLGTLSVATQIAFVPTNEMKTPILRSAFPGFRKLYPDLDKLRDAYQRVQSLVFLLSMPLAFGMVMVAEPMVMLFLGEEWVGGIIVIQLLAGGAGLQSMSNPVNPMAMAMGKTKTLFYRNLLNTISRIFFVVPGLLLGGLIGLLLARLVHSLLTIAMNMHLARKFLSLDYFTQIAVNMRTIVATALMAAAVAGIDLLLPEAATNLELALDLAAKVAVGGIAFAGTLFAIRLVSKKHGPEEELVQLSMSFFGRFFPKPAQGHP